MAKVMIGFDGAPTIWCPGCECAHRFDARWSWNQDMVKPTFRPSLNVNATVLRYRCHLFITDGKVQFMPDSGHHLAGETVDLPDWLEALPS